MAQGQTEKALKIMDQTKKQDSSTPPPSRVLTRLHAEPPLAERVTWRQPNHHKRGK